jgi:hypothetical protein
MPPVEGGIEACDLRKRRVGSPHCMNGRKVRRLMQRGQRHQRFQLCEHVIVDQRWRAELHPAMNDPVSDGNKSGLSADAAKPLRDGANRSTVIVHVAGIKGLLH